VLFVRKGSDAVASHSRPSAVSTLPDDKALFPLAFSLLPQAREAVGGLSVATDDGTLLRYSIDPRLQQSMQQYFEKTGLLTPFLSPLSRQPAGSSPWQRLRKTRHGSLMPPIGFSPWLRCSRL